MEAWRDHPYVDIIDNRSDFDSKINRLIDLVVKRIGINVGDRYERSSFLPSVYQHIIFFVQVQCKLSQGEICDIRNVSRLGFSSQVYRLSGTQ